MRVAVVTDSAAALPAELVAELGVVVVPMWVTIGGRAFREDELALERVAEPEGPITTSAPSPGDVRAALDRALGRPGVEAAVVVTVARRLSGVYGSARIAAEAYGGRVRVVDSGTAAGAEGLVAVAAARLAAAGGSVEEVEAAARRAAARVRLVATLADLERVARSGRIPGVAAWAGRTLGLRPLIELRAGRIRPLRPTRSASGAIDRIVAACLEGRTPGAVLHAAAMHALAPEPAERLLAILRERVELATAIVAPFGPVMVAHTGPDLFGLAWWWEEPST